MNFQVDFCVRHNDDELKQAAFFGWRECLFQMQPRGEHVPHRVLSHLGTHLHAYNYETLV